MTTLSWNIFNLSFIYFAYRVLVTLVSYSKLEIKCSKNNIF